MLPLAPVGILELFSLPRLAVTNQIDALDYDRLVLSTTSQGLPPLSKSFLPALRLQDEYVRQTQKIEGAFQLACRVKEPHSGNTEARHSECWFLQPVQAQVRLMAFTETPGLSSRAAGVGSPAAVTYSSVTSSCRLMARSWSRSPDPLRWQNSRPWFYLVV